MITFPPIVNHPSARLKVLQQFPNWLLVSEVSPEIWVVIEAVKVELPLRRATYFNVNIIDSSDNFKVLSWYGQARSYDLALDYYHEALHVATELYRK